MKQPQQDESIVKTCHQIGSDRIRFDRINTSHQSSAAALKTRRRSDSILQISGFKFQASASSCQSFRFQTQDFRLQLQQGASIMAAVAPCFVNRFNKKYAFGEAGMESRKLLTGASRLQAPDPKAAFRIHTPDSRPHVADFTFTIPDSRLSTSESSLQI